MWADTHGTWEYMDGIDPPRNSTFADNLFSNTIYMGLYGVILNMDKCIVCVS